MSLLMTYKVYKDNKRTHFIRTEKKQRFIYLIKHVPRHYSHQNRYYIKVDYKDGTTNEGNYDCKKELLKAATAFTEY